MADGSFGKADREDVARVADTPVQVHPLVRVAFEALERMGVDCCLLHGEANLESPIRDVDVLVSPSDVNRLGETLDLAGFAPIAGVGAGGHYVAAAFGAFQGGWVVLDVVSELSYGPTRNFMINWLRPRFETDAARACLARRVGRGSYSVLAPDDAFWSLLLNCIIDKGRIPERHATELTRLLQSVRGDGPIAKAIDAWCPPDWTTDAIVSAVRAQRWNELLKLGPELAKRQTSAHPLKKRLQAFATGVRRLRAYVRDGVSSHGPGISVALLGPDGAGKSTLAARIRETSPIRCKVVYMGLWQGTNDGRTFLRDAGDVVVRPFKIWRLYMRGALSKLSGTVVIFDRYVYDAWLPPHPPLVRLKKPYFALLRRACPAPDLVLVLDAPGTVMQERKPDSSSEELESMRQVYLRLARKLPRAQIVDASRDGDAVFNDAALRIWNAYTSKAAGRAGSTATPSSARSPRTGGKRRR